MKMQRRFTKREVLGQLRVEVLFTTKDLPGIDPMCSRWQVLGAFQKAGEARVERLVETDGGLIFLSSIPNRPNTGAIYVYHEATGAFLWMRFDRDDDLNGSDFDKAVWAYKLSRYADMAVNGVKARSEQAPARPIHERRQYIPNTTGLHLVS